MKTSLTALFITVLIILCAVFAQAQPVELEYKFHKGDVYKYKMHMDLGMQIGVSGMPVRDSSSMVVDFSYRLTVLDVMDDGSARLQFKYDSFKAASKKSYSVGFNEEAMKKSEIIYVYDKKGRLLEIEKMVTPGASREQDLSSNMQNSTTLSQTSAFLPLDPVDVGDTWNQTTVLPMGKAGTLSADSTVLATDEKVFNQPCAKIRQDFSSNIDLGEIASWQAKTHPSDNPNANVAMHMIEGTSVATGSVVYYFATDLGIMLTAEGTLNVDNVINKPVPGDTSGKTIKVMTNMSGPYTITKYK